MLRTRFLHLKDNRPSERAKDYTTAPLMNTHASPHARTHKYAQTHTHTHTHTHTRARTYAHTHSHTHTHYTNTRTCTHTDTHSHTHVPCVSVCEAVRIFVFLGCSRYVGLYDQHLDTVHQFKYLKEGGYPRESNCRQFGARNCRENFLTRKII